MPRRHPLRSRSPQRPLCDALEQRQLLAFSGQLDPAFGTAGSLQLSSVIRDTPPAIGVSDGTCNFLAMNNRLFKTTLSGALVTDFGDGGQVILPGDGRITGIAFQDPGYILLSVASYSTDDALLYRLTASGAMDAQWGTSGLIQFDYTFPAPLVVGSTVTLTVPAAGNPWLAGMPNGTTTLDGLDSAPAQSPVQLPAGSIAPGDSLTFTATGLISTGGVLTFGADGNTSNIVSPLVGGSNQIASLTAPEGALVGIFLDNNAPAGQFPVPDALSYATNQSRNTRTIRPQLRQPFFIGDGLTDQGQLQRFIVPNGATRLFLGAMDASQWSNNTGGFVVLVTISSRQQPGDPGQGGGGVELPVETDYIMSSADAMAILSDGTIVVAGRYVSELDAEPQIAMARFTPTGQVDPAFGQDGTSVLDTSDLGFTATSLVGMTLQSGDRLVLLQQITTAAGLTTFTLARVDDTGAIDPAFGTLGYSELVDDGSHTLTPYELQVDLSGRLLVGANQAVDPAPAPDQPGGVILRFTADGIPDAAFGIGGMAQPPQTVSSAGVLHFTVAADNSIIAADAGAFRLLRFTSAGLFDPTFTSPISTFGNPGATARIDSLVFQPDGKLLALGATTIPDATPASARLDVARYIGDANSSPTVRITGPFGVPETENVVPTFTARAFGGRTITRYDWDFDYDGMAFTIDFTGPNPSIPAGVWNGPSFHTIALRATDSAGNLSNIAQAIILVTNVAPQTTLEAPVRPAVINTPFTVNLTATDQDTIAYWTINWGDGSTSILPGNPPTASHTYLALGNITITATATDADGGTSDPLTIDTRVIPFPQIAGHVYLDPTYSGTYTGQEGLADAAVFLDANGDGIVQMGEPMAFTDAEGFYYFSGRTIGIYNVTLIRPGGIYFTVPNTGIQTVLVLDTAQTQTADFGVADFYGATALVFADDNGNGVQDVGETGFAGATIWADLNNDGIPDVDEPSAITSAQGVAIITPLRVDAPRFRALFPAGFTATTNLAGTTVQPPVFGAQGRAAISGSIYHDLNGNGTRQVSEPGVPGATAFIDLNGNGALDPGEPSTLADPSGAFAFLNIPPGTYTVRVSPPLGWRLSGGSTGAAQVTRALNQPVAGLSFPITRTDSITGTVFRDTSGDGVRQAHEAVLPNVTVYLDLNGDGRLGPGEPRTLSSATGRYTFSNVPITQGQRVRVEVPAGLRAITPLGVPLEAGQTILDIALMPRITIAGAVFVDANRNRLFDLREDILRRIQVFVDLDEDGRLSRGDIVTSTDKNGVYRFKDLLPGTYTIRIVPPTGYHMTTPAALRITAAAGQVLNRRNFGLL